MKGPYLRIFHSICEGAKDHKHAKPANGNRSIDLSSKRDPSHLDIASQSRIMAKPRRRVPRRDSRSAMQQRRNEMATKRSKRASKASAARSKRKVRARATPA